MPGFSFDNEEVLILTKTYPSPSLKYRETTCVAGVNRAGKLRRIFPVPFRLLQGESRFKRWEWVGMNLSRKNSDVRPESRKIDIDSIVRSDDILDTSDGWSKRLAWIRPHLVSDFDALESRRQMSGETLGLIEPSRCLELEITPVDQPEWTADEIQKLQTDVSVTPSALELPLDLQFS